MHLIYFICITIKKGERKRSLLNPLEEAEIGTIKNEKLTNVSSSTSHKSTHSGLSLSER